jgi:hypothetical protein
VVQEDRLHTRMLQDNFDKTFQLRAGIIVTAQFTLNALPTLLMFCGWLATTEIAVGRFDVNGGGGKLETLR